MNKTFTVMKSNIGSNIQDTSSAMSTIIGRFINDTYADFLRRVNHQAYEHTYTFDTIANQQDYILPANFGKELYVFDGTNKKELSRIDLQTLIDSFGSTFSDAGTAARYMIIPSRVQYQPSSASVITFVSSSASDTTQQVLVRGISDGVEIVETVTLTGTSSAATTNTFTKVISLSKTAVTVGKVTATSNSGTVNIAVIPPQILDYRIILLRLHPIPSAVVTIYCPYIIAPQPLYNDYDTLIVAADDIIEDGATARALRYKRQYAKAQDFERLFEKGITNYIWNAINQPNQIYQMNTKPYSRDTV